MTDGGAAVRIEELWASYRKGLRRQSVLRGVGLEALPGAVTAIIGRNGVGKTTLFRSLIGLQRPDRGTITIAGLPVRAYRERHGIGCVPESISLPASWTVGDILGHGVDLTVEPGGRQEAFARAVERGAFDAQTIARPARRCSKGLKQRLLLAYALIGEPEVLLLDEPFSALDPPSRIALRGEITRTVERGVTVLLASHDLNEVTRLADSVFMMEDGEVRQRDLPRADPGGADDDLEADFREDDR
ncbi:MAG: ATP-binding cassette domain-containing protein [Longimicrobiales bacterium]|nr:ATP-binding cassette domain-containing protein [Longimicrobiales bacterium]